MADRTRKAVRKCIMVVSLNCVTLEAEVVDELHDVLLNHRLKNHGLRNIELRVLEESGTRSIHWKQSVKELPKELRYAGVESLASNRM